MMDLVMIRFGRLYVLRETLITEKNFLDEKGRAGLIRFLVLLVFKNSFTQWV